MTFSMKEGSYSDDELRDEIKSNLRDLVATGESTELVACITQEVADEMIAEASGKQGKMAQVELRRELRELIRTFESETDIRMYQIANVLEDFEECTRHQSYQEAFLEEAAVGDTTGEVATSLGSESPNSSSDIR